MLTPYSFAIHESRYQTDPDTDDTDALTLVPTLHVLFTHTLPPTLVPRTYPAHLPGSTDMGSYTPAHADSGNDANTDAGIDTETEMTKVREELVEWIAEEALGGDRDAAEWVLLVSIARVCVLVLSLSSIVTD
jgi:hypothetical protein